MRQGRPADRVRVAAARLLARWQRERRHVEDLVERHDDQCESAAGGAWSYAERRRLRELVFSCVRLKGRYDHVLASRSRSAKAPSPELRAVFWIALHELVELEHKPHAVVDEAVRTADAVGAGYARGFVNGLLRGLLRDGLRSDFPDRSRAADFATTWLSHPRWLVERWAAAHGDDAMLGLCTSGNARPKICLRSAPRRREQLAAALHAMDWQTSPVDFLPDGLELLTRVPPSLLLSQVDESCAIQDAAAQLVAPLVAAARPALVLDLCAAPGGKATHLAALLPDARIVACDLSASRLARLGPAAGRLGLADRMDVAVVDAAHPAFRKGSFDAVLLDAPCTGTGVLARRHEARWVRRPEDVGELAALQRVLLDRAVDLVRPGGVVLYATCSLEPEENDEVVDFVLSRREDVRESPIGSAAPPEFLSAGRLRTWPHRHGIDGAFAARLEKIPTRTGEEDLP